MREVSTYCCTYVLAFDRSQNILWLKSINNNQLQLFPLQNFDGFRINNLMYPCFVLALFENLNDPA
jgi:hypothetical protein